MFGWGFVKEEPKSEAEEGPKVVPPKAMVHRRDFIGQKEEMRGRSGGAN